MMVEVECPNCGRSTNASDSRLVRDACGHRKCRLCLVYEEDGCKACQTEHRIQMIGDFDYPLPSSAMASQSVDSNSSNTGSEKEEIILQPLELVTNKALDHDRDPFDEPESCGSQWIDDRDMDIDDVSESQNDEGKMCCDVDTQNSNQSNSVAVLQRHISPDQDRITDFSAIEHDSDSVPSETHALRMEPLELVTNVRNLIESQDRQDLLDRNIDGCEKDGKHGDSNVEKIAAKPKGRKNCKMKRNHISVIPGIQETYKCNICCKTFKSSTAQRYHDSCLTGVKPYQCTLCDKSFVKFSHFQYHERSHTGYKPFECSFCGKAFPQRNKLNRHLHSHRNEKRFKCSVCEKGYNSRDDLRSHMNMHSGVTPYSCLVCKKSFREASNLTRHMHTHSNERPYMCEQCGKSFKDKSLLVRHRRTHGKDRPFSCSDCSRVFLSKSELTRHLAVHSDDKPFPCLYCSTVFRRKDNLNRHTRHHHSEDRAAQVEKKSNEEDTELIKSKLANSTKQKAKLKDKPKSSSTALPKSPVKKSVHYLNSLEQINSRLDSRSNVIPVIRTTSELSNAVPVINGPISIKRPEETTNSPKKAFTHTEPIPLAEAVVINRRIEEKLYPKTDSNHDCYFSSDFCNRVDRPHTVHMIKPVRSNLSNKSTPAGKIYSPERSFFEPLVSQGRTQSPLIRKDYSSENDYTQTNMTAAWNDSQDTKDFNTPKHTVPKKRAIEELKSKPMTVNFLESCSGSAIETQQSSCSFEPERANCVPTITKTGHANIGNDLKEFNSNNFDNKILNVNNVKKLSDIHWRRRTSEILKPRIQGFNELEMTDEMTDMNNKG